MGYFHNVNADMSFTVRLAYAAAGNDRNGYSPKWKYGKIMKYSSVGSVCSCTSRIHPPAYCVMVTMCVDDQTFSYPMKWPIDDEECMSSGQSHHIVLLLDIPSKILWPNSITTSHIVHWHTKYTMRK